MTGRVIEHGVKLKNSVMLMPAVNASAAVTNHIYATLSARGAITLAFPNNDSFNVNHSRSIKTK